MGWVSLAGGWLKISCVYSIALTGFVYKTKSSQNDCRLPKAHPMARQARKASMDPDKVQVFHIIKRCVRRAFLCGFDRVSNRSLAHRKQWLRERMEFLNSVFAIDCLTYAIMSNHCHLILRSRPDLVAQSVPCNSCDCGLFTTNACCPEANSCGDDFQIETQSWLIRYLDSMNQTILQGSSSTPITPPTKGWGISICGKRYLVESVTVLSFPNPSGQHLDTVIDVRLKEAP